MTTSGQDDKPTKRWGTLVDDLVWKLRKLHPDEREREALSQLADLASEASQSPPVNRVWPSECVHVRNGELRAIESLELTIRATTLPGHDADFRYVKGPDQIVLCALCAGRVIGFLLRPEIAGAR